MVSEKMIGKVGLSFDDGPNKDNIQEILDILGEYDCRATFFWVVKTAKDFPGEHNDLFQRIIRQIREAGHEIGLHGLYDYHPTFISRIYSKFSRDEMKVALKELEELTGQKITLYRPHYLFQPVSIIFARQLGLTTVFGSFVYYADPVASIESQIKRFSSAKSGNILIFHDGLTLRRRKTHIIKVLPSVLDNLKKSGLLPTKISELLIR